MNLDIGTIEHSGQWALKIADSIGATRYINPPSGAHLFKEDEFKEKNIQLEFIKANLTPYIQRRGGFVPGLSILDVMMWNNKNEIKQLLNEYEIVKQSQVLGIEKYK
jgi:hypothetical protein